MENQAIWEQISNPITGTPANGSTGNFRAMGPTPDAAGSNTAGTSVYAPFITELPTLRCPSDPGSGAPALARTNYAACLGDSIRLMLMVLSVTTRVCRPFTHRKLAVPAAVFSLAIKDWGCETFSTELPIPLCVVKSPRILVITTFVLVRLAERLRMVAPWPTQAPVLLLAHQSSTHKDLGSEWNSINSRSRLQLGLFRYDAHRGDYHSATQPRNVFDR